MFLLYFVLKIFTIFNIGCIINVRLKEMRFFNMDEVKDTNYDKPIKQSKDLPRFRYKLSLIEHKILLCFFGQLKQNNKTFEPEQIPLEDVIKYCGITDANQYRLIKDSTRTLSKESLEYYSGKNYSYVPWFSYIRYKNGVIYYQLNDAIRSELLQLYENNRLYISMDPKILPKFHNNYALRLYLILKGDLISHRTSVAYSLEEICYMLALSSTYSPKNDNRNAVANQRSKIISPSVIEINEVSDMYVDYEPIRQYKKTVGWRFNIKNQSTEEPPMIMDKLKAYPWYENDPNVENAKKELIARGVNETTIPTILKKFNNREDFFIAKSVILTDLAEEMQKNKIENVGGWLYSAFIKYEPLNNGLFDSIEKNISFENTYNLMPEMVNHIKNAQSWKEIISLAKEQENSLTAINIFHYAEKNKNDLLANYLKNCKDAKIEYDLSFQLAEIEVYGTSYIKDPLPKDNIDEVPF